jgi:recombination protein RecT
MTNAVATTSEEPVERALVAMEDKFSAALPAHIPPQRFLRVALSALANPALANARGTPAGRKSIFDACLRAASDGLLLDGREAALVSYGQTVQYQPMVAGVMKKARNSGEIASIAAQVVYENDEFSMDYVTEGPPISHRPLIDGDRGKALGAYAVARLKDGSWTQPEYMTVAEIEHVRKTFSKQPNSLMWTKAWGEGARKTVIRKAAKYWPTSTDKDGQGLVDWMDATGDTQLPSKPTLTAIAAPAKRSAAAILAAAPVNAEPEPDPDAEELDEDM